MTPFFSVIIPLYNKEKYIQNTLNCVFNQSFYNFEVIVVNDGSTDRSLEILEEFNDIRLKIIYQKNQGVSVARNTGMENAKADYICFLDADDSWKTNHLQAFHDTITKFPDAKMYCNRYVTQISKNTFIKNNFIDIEENYEGYVTDFFKSSLINRVALTSAVCIHNDIFNEIGGFDKTISSGQDLEYWIKIAIKYKTAITKNNTLIYNFLDENISLSKTHINNKTIPKFSQFLSEEKINKSLKKFLDLYRIEYALKYHIAGNSERTKELLQNVASENLKSKTKILFYFPSIILRPLLNLKHYLKSNGIDFTVYH
ncbi:glycosyltransferase family 2 protein [Paenimyroides baculatum]|uniref:Glycosyltransferase family 2 protein n=1 Tax=Paenimyroides baculatum TaxID=2608000 RepID=A0A5M6CJK1_9FLAO|nr:glycosyltransferase family 2 protein [Paenimyroides baculatum]KAA5535294.1 glycosyltransferase family 2 protein [Paenimyroides baculatum]